MRKRRLFILLVSLVVSVAGMAQSVTLSFKQAKLERVFAEITRQTGYQFNYSQPTVNPDEVVSIEVSDTPLATALERLCQGKGFTYVIKGQSILLTARKNGADGNDNKKAMVRGRVTDANGEAVIGAHVVVQGSTTGAVTDIDGNFTLADVQNGATLVVSSLGYVQQQVKVTGGNIAVRLTEDNQLLNEVVVVGYGVQRKSDITGSVSSVKASELQSMPTPSTAEALQGRVAGVMVQNSSGDPSGDSHIRIRGANSLTYGNDPLVIIDGVQDASIGSLNPNQIESMEVLKDAAALSVYGSRGANGVIIITTKQGKTERAQISYNGYVSFDHVGRTLPSLGAREYATLMNEAQVENGLEKKFTDSQIAALGSGTSRQDEIFRSAVSHVHNLGISGSKNKISYFIAGGVACKEGIMINSKFNEYTLRANLKAEATKRLTVTLNAFASYSLSQKGDTEGALNSALQWAPTKPVYESNGKYSQPGGGIGPVSLFNPVGLAREMVNDYERVSFNAALTGEYRFTDYLRLSAMLAYKHNSTMSGWFDNQVYNNGPEEDIAGSKTMGMYGALQNTNILTFDKDFDGHHVSATFVYEWHKDKYDSNCTSAKGIPIGMGYQGVHFGTIVQKPWLEYSSTSMMSIMARANYAYKNRYMVSGSFRRDGASQLADGHKWENFAAISAGWNIAEESFMKSLRESAIPELKLRASYGSVGNAAVPAYSSQMKFTPGTDASGNTTLSVSQLTNNNLKWERTTEFNVGIDARFWNNRITFTAEYYDKETTDLLMWRAVPSALGVESVLTNVGSVTNRGWEIAVGGTPVDTHGFKWDINASINFNRNNIVKLDGMSNTLVNSGNVDMPGLVGSFVQTVGQPMGTFLGYTYAGVWQQSEVSTAAMYGCKPGDAKYVDVNRDGVIDANDVGIIGNAQPKFTYGINNTFHYRGFDLNIFFQGVSGNDIYNQNRVRRESYSGGDSFPTNPNIANHWTQNNPSQTPSFSGSEMVNSSRWVEDGSYLRLKSLTLGYTFPREWMGRSNISNLRLYVSARNLWTITDYSGFDPEASMGMDAYGAGIDRGIYPSAKSWIVGLDITF